MFGCMKNLVCPVCGLSVEHQIGGRCRDCFIKNIVLAEVPRVIHAVTCSRCGRFKIGEQWTNLEVDIEEMIRFIVEQAINVHPDARNIVICIGLTSTNPSIFKAHVQVAADVSEVGTCTELDTEVRLSRIACDACSRKAGGYFEALVQIRSAGRFPDENEVKQVKEMVNEVVARQTRKGDMLAFVTKIEKLPEGTDVYLGSNSTARQICRTAAERFGCSFSESSTLAGKEDGKNIYRITYSLRLPRLRPGDIIKIEDKPVLVRHSGKRTSGVYLESGEEFSDNTDRLEGAEKVGDINNAVSAVLISVEKNTVSVMHPKTFRPATIKKPAYLSAGGGDEIKIVIIAGNIYILPSL